jgi:hypothetical protein
MPTWGKVKKNRFWKTCRICGKIYKGVEIQITCEDKSCKRAWANHRQAKLRAIESVDLYADMKEQSIGLERDRVQREIAILIKNGCSQDTSAIKADYIIQRELMENDRISPIQE